MSYEVFRQKIQCKLISMIPTELLQNVLQEIDVIAGEFEINERSTEIIQYGYDAPQVVNWFLSSKAVENISENTIRYYHYRLNQFMSIVRKPIKEINTNDIRAYLYHYKKENGVSDCTIDGVRRVLNSFFAWLVDNDYIDKNPVSKIAPIKFQQHERIPLTAYELELIRWNCRTIREKALIDFLYSSGCRVSEVSDAMIADINWEDRSVVIRHGKGDKRRTVFFNAEAELSLRKYLESRNDDVEYLFATESNRCKGVKLSVRGIQALVREICKRTDIQKHCTPHVFRHTFATMGIKNKIPLERLQALMGHAKPETTLIYAKLDNTDLQREHQRIYS